VASIVDVYVLLDVLLVILIALFVPIGFWRGAYREAFVTLGILFGAALGRFWGETWGVELAAVTRLHESGGAFMIAMLSLISATFLLGYSSGAAIPVPNPGWMARTLGALIAGANGALLLSFALRDIRVYLLSSEEAGFLDSAVIAPFLSDGTGWILLVAAAIFVPISLVLALFGPDVEAEEFFDEDEDEFELYEDDEYPEPYAQRTIQIDNRRPAFARQKQPAPRAPMPQPTPAEETRPIQRVEPPEQSAAGAETQPAPSRQRVHYPQQQTPPPRHAPEVTPRPEPEAHSQPEPQPRPESGNERPEVQPDPESPRPEQRPAVDETQPHRPQFGPQPPPELLRPEPEPEPEPEPQVEGPVFGARSVAPPSGPPASSEPPGVFGYRPTPEQQQKPMRTDTDEFPIPVCPHCQADTAGVFETCPSCGKRLTSSG
jgi:uncharacterized membrane protein required for colicin V production